MLTKNLGDVLEQTRSDQTFKLEMTNITWKNPHVNPSYFAKIKMYDIIKSGVVALRSWDWYNIDTAVKEIIFCINIWSRIIHIKVEKRALISTIQFDRWKKVFIYNGTISIQG